MVLVHCWDHLQIGSLSISNESLRGYPSVAMQSIERANVVGMLSRSDTRGLTSNPNYCMFQY